MNQLPYKSVAIALLYSVILGPVGLLYASFWGGFILIPCCVVMITGQFYYIALVIWLACCIWSVGAVESYNRKLLRTASPS